MTATVLVIDDDSRVRDSVVAYLDDCDYTVQSASQADEAFAAMATDLPDAVICDLKMPGMRGIELLEKIKQYYPDMPVIIVSGAGVMDDVVRALRLGADDFLVKPIIDLAVLEHSLRKALNRLRLEQENRAYREHLEATNRELQVNLEQLRADQLAGREAQLRMLPEPLLLGNLQCTHRLQSSLFLSGDFLDYLDVGQNRVAFYIADVSGHGASSAFVTVLLKNLTYRLRRRLVREESEDILDPSRVLQNINSELLASQLDKHLTIFYGVFDATDSTLIYSTGGHFPMPVLVADGKAASLEGRGMPIGLFPEATYKNYQMTLPDDFSLMLFSDGILEIMTDTSLSDKEGHLLKLAAASDGSLERFWEIADIPGFRDVPDDIAVMTVRRSNA
ncbi:MAG TPA: fused response regulator/phosphatase [Oceanospirillales bacterium]|nr:fused response regulator/phosphatase [Oceanospirillaceae bacterium]HBS42523.1 fused response regulator/phosphatase [Oceanospirillales bacterium]|tara:strand:+ start:40970 stop:42142 length:1173 start_codon:yes stop_codon:yes gene_type:complete